jgi:hypothetical protein
VCTIWITAQEEMPAIIPQEEKLQEQNKKIEESQEKSSVRKKKQKRRVTAYLSHISKQVEKNGNQINKITSLI